MSTKNLLQFQNWPMNIIKLWTSCLCFSCRCDNSRNQSLVHKLKCRKICFSNASEPALWPQTTFVHLYIWVPVGQRRSPSHRGQWIQSCQWQTQRPLALPPWWANPRPCRSGHGTEPRGAQKAYHEEAASSCRKNTISQPTDDVCCMFLSISDSIGSSQWDLRFCFAEIWCAHKFSGWTHDKS